jgi:hypothetical protein
MVDQRLKELRGASRRDFLRWGATVAACLGLERSRFLNVLNDTSGTAAADTAACASTNRLIHIKDGNGGLANWTLPFAVPAVLQGNNAQASHYAIGKGVAAQGYDKPWVNHADMPWQTNSKWKMTAFVAGRNETHTGAPVSVTALGTNAMLAAAASIQQANPTLLPVLAVGINPQQFGTAPGAPGIAATQSAQALVDLFNSAASRALLQAPDNGPLAEAYYKAFLGLNASAGRSTVARQYAVGKISMNLLAKNLSSQLTPTSEDLALFGIGTNTPGAVQNMARAMITTVKAFSLGLTSMLVMRGFNNDPHGMFANGDQNAIATGAAMAKMLNGLHDLAKSKQDPACSSKTLADAMVLTVDGDTFKQPFDRDGWGDGTPMGTNLLYVMGGGYVKTGWFGGLVNGNTAQTFDVATGNNVGYTQQLGATAGQAAAGAALFAVARGDMRRVRDFTATDVAQLVNVNVTG